MISYGRACIDESDIAEVVSVLRSPWLTTGPLVGEFEREFARVVGASHAVACSNGTAALHAVMHARGVGPGDEVIVPANTFVASANCVLYVGARPVFADICARTLLVDPASVAARISPRTKGIVAVDFAGQPCDYAALQEIADRHGLFLHADACHALGASYRGRPVGSLAPSSSFSFHPVKPITTAEGGMVTTDDAELATRVRVFRAHGIATDHRSREAAGTWEYDMAELGYNYRLSDLQCALGRSQLRRLEAFTAARNRVAAFYNDLLPSIPWLEGPALDDGRTHAFHLYAARIRPDAGISQRAAFEGLRARGVGAHVMYRPVYAHSYYRDTLNYPPGLCPRAEAAYRSILVLPIHPGLSDEDLAKIADALAALNESPRDAN